MNAERDERRERLDRIITEYSKAVDFGGTHDPEAVFQKHPDLANDLREFLQKQSEVEPLASDSELFEDAEATFITADEPALQPTYTPATEPESKSRPAGEGLSCFGDYELLAEIARGGMGVVYKARQVTLDRIVALKMILAGKLASDDDVRRFHLEAEAAAKLEHPGIVPIFEVGQHAGQYFFSMGYVNGPSLAQLIVNGPLPPKEAAEIIRQVADAIAFAHDRGVIHRDLKPANVLLARRDRDSTQGGTSSITLNGTPYVPKVTDFGLAKKADADIALTGTGQILGTPGYMPPEQASGRIDEIGIESDVYSLGAVLYCLLTGRPPFQSASVVDTLKQVLEQEPISPRQLNSDVPKDLETICLKCLQKDRRKRFRSAKSLAEDLRRFQEGRPVVARPVGMLSKFWRWGKRNRPIAYLTGVIALLLLVGFAGAVVFIVQTSLHAQRERELAATANQRAIIADQLRIKAQQEHKRAERERDLARRNQQQAEEVLYAMRLASVQRAWRAGEIGRARHLLNLTRPNLRGWEYRYLDHLINQPTLIGHRFSIRSLAFHPDGTRLVSGSNDRTLRIWNIKTRKKIRSIDRYKSAVVSTTFDPEGTRILSICEGKELVELLDVETGESSVALEGSRPLIAADFHPEGDIIAGAGNNKSVLLWNARTGALIKTLPRKNHLRSVAFSPNGKQLAIVGYRMMMLWDVEASRETRIIPEARLNTQVAWSPDGRRIAAGTSDNLVKVWDADSGRTLMVLKGHTDAVNCVIFSPDGNHIFSGSRDHTIKIWNARSGQNIKTFRGHTFSVRSLAITRDGRTLASAGDDKTIKLWEPESVQGTRSLKGHSRQVSAVAVDPNGGKRIVSGDLDGFIKVWNLPAGKEVTTFRAHRARITSLVFAPRANNIASASRDKTIRISVPATGAHVVTLRDGSSYVNSIAFRPDGNDLVSGSFDKSVRIWDAKSGKVLRRLKGHTLEIKEVGYSPDGKQIVSAGNDKALRIWDAQTGGLLKILSGHTAVVTSVAFSPNGKQIASADQEGNIKIWNSTTARAIYTLQGHKGRVWSVRFSPRENRFISVGSDRTLKFWNSESAIQTLIIQTDTICMSAAFSPDGESVVCGGTDGTISIWEAKSNRLHLAE